MLEQLAQAAASVFSWQALGMILVGTIIGIVVGALPGLTATMAMAIFSPLTFFTADQPFGVDAGDLDDLADVVAGVAQGAGDGQRHGVRLAPNRDRLSEVFRRQTPECRQQAGPAPLPAVQQFRPAGERVHELVVPVPPRLLPIEHRE